MVCELEGGSHIADRVNVAASGPQAAIHGNSSPGVRLDADSLEFESLDIGPPARGDQYLVGGHAFATLEH